MRCDADCYVGRLTLGRAARRSQFRETSVEAILERTGGKRMRPEEFDKYFGHLPTDGEG